MWNDGTTGGISFLQLFACWLEPVLLFVVLFFERVFSIQHESIDSKA
jgi:hypothetical protein